jgi:hypothetical protein
VSRTRGRSGEVAEFRLDHDLVGGLLAGTLGPREEHALAEQLVRLLPFRASLPPPIADDLAQVIARAGGEHELLDWLAERPDRPRLVAQLYRLIGLLDWYSGNPAVADALREIRPDDTLGDLASGIEQAIGEDRLNKATHLAIDAAATLERAARHAIPADPSISNLAMAAPHVRAAIADAYNRM